MRTTPIAPCVLLSLVAMVSPLRAQEATRAPVTGAASTDLRASLAPVPAPDLGGLDAVVADQLRTGRDALKAALADTNATAPQLAAAYGHLGQLYHVYGLLDPAAACYGNATQLDPQDFRWPHLLGDVARKQGNLAAAAAHFQAAWSLEPKDFAALVYLAGVELELGDEAAAEKTYRAALTLSPGSASVLAGLGQLALKRHEYADAASNFEAALAAVPDANRLHYSLAMAYRGLGRADEAKRQLELRGTVGVRPRDPLLDQLQSLAQGETVHILRGRQAFAAGRFEEARDEFAAAVAADPTSTTALVNLGTVLARLGDRAAAADRFRQVLTLDDTNTTAKFDLGSLLLGDGKAAEAIPYLEGAATALPNDAEAQLTLARAYVAARKDASSLPSFQRVAELDPASEPAVLEGAAALVRMGSYARAKSVLEAGLKRMPGSDPIAFALARLLAAAPDAAVRDGARALTLAQRVWKAQPTPRHAQLVAQTLGELGRCDEAAQWQQKVVDAAVADGATAALDALRADLDMYRGGVPCRPPTREPPSQVEH